MIYYEHEMPPEPFWSLEDALHFRIAAPPVTTDPYVLKILLSFEASCPQGVTRLWRNKGNRRAGGIVRMPVFRGVVRSLPFSK